MPDITWINTTPHDINLKCQNGISTVPPSSNKDIFNLFRGITTAGSGPEKIIEVSADTGFITVTGAPTYSIDVDEFNRLVPDSPTPVVYLVSTITAGMIKSSIPVAPKNCRFMVPYSGPDPAKCFRKNGSIEWVAELIDYTP